MRWIRISVSDRTTSQSRHDLAISAEPQETAGVVLERIRSFLQLPQDTVFFCSADATKAGAAINETTGWCSLISAGVIADGDTITAEARSTGSGAVAGVGRTRLGATLAGPASPNDLAVAQRIELAVTGGPNAGARFPLAGGRLTIGRATSNDIVLDDGTVSRCHAVVEQTPTRLFIATARRDVPLLVDGCPLRFGARQVLSLGSTLRIGTSLLSPRLASPPNHGGSASISVPPMPPMPQDALPLPEETLPENHMPQEAPPDSHIAEVARPPDGESTPPSLSAPEPPDQPRPRSLTLATLIAPLVVAAVLVAATGSWLFLLMCAVSPILALAGFLSDRRSGKRRGKAHERRYREECQAFSRYLVQVLRHERSDLESRFPDLATLCAGLAAGAVPTQNCGLTAPEPQFRLGLATVPSRVEIDGAVPDFPGSPPQDTKPDSGKYRPGGTRWRPAICSAPVGVTLRSTLLIVADNQTRVGLASSLIVQLSAVGAWLVIAAPDPGNWEWARWLPRCAREDSVGAAVAVARTLDDPGRRVVMFIESEGESQGVLSAASAWQEEHPERRHIVVLAPRQPEPILSADRLTYRSNGGAELEYRSVPNQQGMSDRQNRAVVGLNSALSCLRDVSGISLDLLRSDVAETAARSLGRTGAGADHAGDDRTGSASLSTLLRCDRLSLTRRWNTTPYSTRVPLGLGETGPVCIDLARDGPHAVIAGTTGSGKSEFLQSLIFALAAVNRPDELQFVLIDYKGGSAFSECSRLPHAVGTVTDLDPQLAGRALRSLRAELKRRERLFAEFGAADLDGYRRLRQPDSPRVARLVVVIDEFRVLADELPDLISGLVRLAAVGRSLGVHLIVATQRPAGAVNADMKANMNLRIALRVRDAADSADLLDAPDAARIRVDQPGRGFIRSGNGPLIEFHAARAFGADDAAVPDDSPSVRLMSTADFGLGWAAFLKRAAATSAQAPVDPTDFAGAAEEIPRQAGPWLAPLPARVSTDDLPADAQDGRSNGLAIGLADCPELAAQPPLHWDLPHDGHLIVAGTSRTGRTSCVRTVLSRLGRPNAPETHVYILDATHDLRAAEALPFVGAIVTLDDDTRLARLLQRLSEEVSDRRRLFNAHQVTTIDEFQRAADASLPYLLLIIDGWEALSAKLEQLDGGRPVDVLIHLVRDGIAAGVRVLVTGGRSLLTSRLASLIPARLLLRLADRADLLLMGVPSAHIPAAMPPGRALLLGPLGGFDLADPLEVQLAIDDGAYSAAPPRSAKPGMRQPFRVRPLPDRILLRALLPATPAEEASSGIDPTPIVLGVGGDDLACARWDPGRRPGTLLIAGPRGSGRSNALAVIAEQAVAQRRTILCLAYAEGALQEFAETAGLSLGDGPVVAAAQAIATAAPGTLYLVDDLETVPREIETALLDRLVTGSTSLKPARDCIVCAGVSSLLGGGYSGLVPAMRAGRSGILLNPSGYADGEVLGLRVGTPGAQLPGRGLLALGRTPQPIQLALWEP
ncbi:FtsK/SpoIIIE domain-containing protein [Saxibacter everestensis]|uniref:FtsK/SpoIIIE domain-containing protein n=1 Tax=Saxibacter everestensis TaxID=2909229 RepID=A0ABY8QPT6_9MICO|nr:FtsK/SpoIIIE domain-containing protein [Brevibacteriaceae bacterium ZFBP1038]